MKRVRPDIYLFHDARAFMREHLAYLKGSRPGANVATIAREAKISKAFLSMYLAGKRELSEKVLSKLLPFLGLTKGEESYMRLLCLLASEESQSEKIRILDQINKMRGYQKLNPKESVVYRYLTRWYYVAIREMASLPGFKLEAGWIQERLREPVPLSDIETALEFLIENKFLEVGPKGKVRPPERRLECMDQIYRAALIQYYKQLFDLAVEDIPQVDTNQKNLTGHMVALSAEGFGRIKSLLEETLDKVVKIANEDKGPQAVFQVSLLGFPITKLEMKK